MVGFCAEVVILDARSSINSANSANGRTLNAELNLKSLSVNMIF